MKTTACRSCGEPIIWATLPSGKKCPMDASMYNRLEMPTERIHVYSLSEEGKEVAAASIDKAALLDTTRFYISHFSTCPNADHHRGKDT